VKEIRPVVIVLILRFIVHRTESKNSDEEKEEKLKRSGYSIGDEVPNPLEYASGYEDAVHYSGQTRLCQYDVRCCSCSISGSLGRNEMGWNGMRSGVEWI
jgi:hypothetical protein